MTSATARIHISGNDAVIDISGPIGLERMALREDLRRLMGELSSRVTMNHPVIMLDDRRVRVDRIRVRDVDFGKVTELLRRSSHSVHFPGME